MPFRPVPHRLLRQGLGGRSTADNAAMMRPPPPCRIQPCSTLSGCRPAGGKPPARLRVLSVLARFTRSQAPMRIPMRSRFARFVADPRSLRSLGGSRFPPMPLRPVPHRLLRQGLGGRSTADNAAMMRPPTPCRLQPCSTLSGCRPAVGKPPARLRVLSVLARFARSQAPMRLVLRAAVRLRLSVGLLPTDSNALAFRALCRRASLPSCANMFGSSPAPCGARANAGAPAPLGRPCGLCVR